MVGLFEWNLSKKGLLGFFHRLGFSQDKLLCSHVLVYVSYILVQDIIVKVKTISKNTGNSISV